jgi:hypothetical protein
MKIFILGLPKSGRTTAAKAIAEQCNNLNDTSMYYINAVEWIKHTFRFQNEKETAQQYNDLYHEFLLNRIKNDPDMVLDNVYDTTDAYGIITSNWVIDGLFSPRDFCRLFDYNHDIVVFLNRTDYEVDAKDYEAVGVSVIRDYCFWLASGSLLSRDHWIEYNFKMNESDSQSVKMLGSKNSVYIVKSINRVISHLVEIIKDLS